MNNLNSVAEVSVIKFQHRPLLLLLLPFHLFQCHESWLEFIERLDSTWGYVRYRQVGKTNGFTGSRLTKPITSIYEQFYSKDKSMTISSRGKMSSSSSPSTVV